MTFSKPSFRLSLPLSVPLLLLLAACSSSKATYVDQPVSEADVANVIAPPADVESLFASAPAPNVDGVTTTEPAKSVIAGYQTYQIKHDLQLYSGQLNHAKGAAISVLSFKVAAADRRGDLIEKRIRPDAGLVGLLRLIGPGHREFLSIEILYNWP